MKSQVTPDNFQQKMKHSINKDKTNSSHYQNSERSLLAVVTVDVGEEENSIIKVYQGDDVIQLAYNFCQQHFLEDDCVAHMVKHINQQINAAQAKMSLSRQSELKKSTDKDQDFKKSSYSQQIGNDKQKQIQIKDQMSTLSSEREELQSQSTHSSSHKNYFMFNPQDAQSKNQDYSQKGAIQQENSTERKSSFQSSSASEAGYQIHYEKFHQLMIEKNSKPPLQQQDKQQQELSKSNRGKIMKNESDLNKIHYESEEKDIILSKMKQQGILPKAVITVKNKEKEMIISNPDFSQKATQNRSKSAYSKSHHLHNIEEQADSSLDNTNISPQNRSNQNTPRSTRSSFQQTSIKQATPKNGQILSTSIYQQKDELEHKKQSGQQKQRSQNQQREQNQDMNQSKYLQKESKPQIQFNLNKSTNSSKNKQHIPVIPSLNMSYILQKDQQSPSQHSFTDRSYYSKNNKSINDTFHYQRISSLEQKASQEISNPTEHRRVSNSRNSSKIEDGSDNENLNNVSQIKRLKGGDQQLQPLSKKYKGEKSYDDNNTQKQVIETRQINSSFIQQESFIKQQQPRQLSAPNTNSSNELLVNKLLQRQKENNIIEINHENKNEEEEDQEQKFNKFLYQKIFNKMDADKDGQISIVDVCIEELNTELLKILSTFLFYMADHQHAKYSFEGFQLYLSKNQSVRDSLYLYYLDTYQKNGQINNHHTEATDNQYSQPHTHHQLIPQSKSQQQEQKQYKPIMMNQEDLNEKLLYQQQSHYQYQYEPLKIKDKYGGSNLSELGLKYPIEKPIKTNQMNPNSQNLISNLNNNSNITQKIEQPIPTLDRNFSFKKPYEGSESSNQSNIFNNNNQNPTENSILPKTENPKIDFTNFSFSEDQYHHLFQKRTPSPDFNSPQYNIISNNNGNSATNNKGSYQSPNQNLNAQNLLVSFSNQQFESDPQSFEPPSFPKQVYELSQQQIEHNNFTQFKHPEANQSPIHQFPSLTPHQVQGASNQLQVPNNIVPDPKIASGRYKNLVKKQFNTQSHS